MKKQEALDRCNMVKEWLQRDGKPFLLEVMGLGEPPKTTMTELVMEDGKPTNVQKEIIRRGSFIGELANVSKYFLLVASHRSGAPIYDKIIEEEHFVTEFRTDEPARRFNSRIYETRRFVPERKIQGDLLGFTPMTANRGLLVQLGWAWLGKEWEPSLRLDHMMLTPRNELPVRHIDEILAKARGETYQRVDMVNDPKKAIWRIAREYDKKHGRVDSRCIAKLREAGADDELIDRIINKFGGKPEEEPSIELDDDDDIELDDAISLDDDIRLVPDDEISL